MIQRSSVLVFICIGLALIANANARPQRRDLGTLTADVPKKLVTLLAFVAQLKDQVDDTVDDNTKIVLTELDQVTALLVKLQGEITTILRAGTSAVNIQLSLTEQVLNTVDGKLKKVALLIVNVAGNVKQIKSILKEVVGLLNELTTTVLELVKTIVILLTGTLQKVPAILATLKALEANAVGAQLTELTEVIKQITNVLPNLNKIQDTVNNIVFSLDLKGKLDNIKATLATVTEKLDAVTGLLNIGISKIFVVSGLVDEIVSLVGDLLNLVLGLVGTLLGTLTGALNLNLVRKRALYY